MPGNQLHKLPDTLGGLECLAELHISQNKLTELPPSMGDMKHLHTLRAARNELTSLPDTMCKGLTSQCLKKLNIQANKIAQLPSTFRGLVALEELTYDLNPIRSPPPELANRGVAMVMGYIAERSERIKHLKRVMQHNGLSFSAEAMEPKSEDVLVGESVRYLTKRDRALFDKQVSLPKPTRVR
jgi:hypothetical protein